MFEMLGREENRGIGLLTGVGAENEGRAPRVDELNVVAVEPPRECRGGRIVDCTALAGGAPIGVWLGSTARCLAGVIKALRPLAEASESGGEGGVVCTVDAFDFGPGGGVEIVGEDTVVADVESSEAGDGGRRLSVSRCVGFRVCSRSIVASASCNLRCVISASICMFASSSR